MTEELAVLRDITTRLEAAGIDYMLTGSVGWPAMHSRA